jgi:putative lipoic acid-binding regulatory protein
MSAARPSPFEFPCSFPIKVFGRDEDEFEALVISIIRHHVPELHPENVSSRLSDGGKYLAVTATFIANSRDQLDALYMELSAHDRVLMVL